MEEFLLSVFIIDVSFKTFRNYIKSIAISQFLELKNSRFGLEVAFQITSTPKILSTGTRSLIELGFSVMPIPTFRVDANKQASSGDSLPSDYREPTYTLEQPEV